MPQPWFDAPGNIRTQVGQCLNSMREAVEQHDVDRLADLTMLLLTLASPKLPPEYQTNAELQVPGMEPGRDRDGRKARAVFQACLRITARVLSDLAKLGIYASRETPWDDDAPDLALTDGDAGASPDRTAP